MRFRCQSPLSPVSLVGRPVELTWNQQSSRPHKVKAQPQPGYIYLYAEDGMEAARPFSLLLATKPPT